MEKGIVSSVGLTIHAKDGRIKEIPLENWQVEVIAQMLGLCVNLPDLDDYVMSSKESVNERMALYYSAMKSIN